MGGGAAVRREAVRFVAAGVWARFARSFERRADLHGTVKLIVTSDAYRLLRRRLGRAILLGLEFLIIADIVLTIFMFRGIR